MSECAASTAHFITGVYQPSTSSWTLSRRMKAEDETLSPSELTKNTKSMYSLEFLGLGGESEVTAETQTTFSATFTLATYFSKDCVTLLIVNQVRR